jgi:hypothetical protein
MMLAAATLGCGSLWTSSDDARAAALPPTAPPTPVADTVATPPPSPGYPIDSSPPKDFFSEALLRTLAREASFAISED